MSDRVRTEGCEVSLGGSWDTVPSASGKGGKVC
jgi:hypothetical protein